MTERLADDAYLELLQDGRFGQLCAELTGATVAEVAGVYRASASYPTLYELWTWTDDDIAEATSEFLVHMTDTSRMDSLVAVSIDGQSLAGGLHIRCQSWFQERSRSTDIGAISRKLDDALCRGADQGNVANYRVPGDTAWHRVQDPPHLYDGSDRPLIVAAHATPISRLRWNSEHRRDPITDKTSLLNVCLAGLAAVAKAVLRDTLLRVTTHRLGIDTRGNELLDIERHDPGVDDAFQDGVLIEALAAQILHDLGDVHGKVLAVASDDTSLAAVQAALGVGRSKAGTMKRAAIDAICKALAHHVQDDPELAMGVAARTLGLVRLRFARTALASPASDVEGDDK